MKKKKVQTKKSEKINKLVKQKYKLVKKWEKTQEARKWSKKVTHLGEKVTN